MPPDPPYISEVFFVCFSNQFPCLEWQRQGSYQSLLSKLSEISLQLSVCTTAGSGGGDRLQNKIRELQKELSAAKDHLRHAEEDARKVSTYMYTAQTTKKVHIENM